MSSSLQATSDQSAPSDSKTWVVEVHRADGAPADFAFAILRLDQTFIDRVAALSRALEKSLGLYAEADRNLPLLTSEVSFLQDEHGSAGFVGSGDGLLPAPSCWTLFTDGDQDAVLRFEFEDRDGTTGIVVKELCEKFDGQASDEVVVMARPEHYEVLGDDIEDALHLCSKGVVSISEADQAILLKAMLKCRDAEPGTTNTSANTPAQ
jgi:hypothetical protein